MSDYRSTFDDAVLTEAEFRRMAGGASCQTAHRLDKRGEAPPKMQLSARRIDRRLGEMSAWLQSRQQQK
jgi:hypothetical protein